MSEHATGGSTAADPGEGSSPSLADYIGQEMGDLYTVSESPASESDRSAGAPPADASAATPEDPTGAEGTDADAERTGEPPADAAIAGPDDAAPAVPQSPDADPFDGATPLPYTVDGQPRTFDGITVLKDGGAIIEPDHVALVAQRLSERDHLYERQQAQHEKYSTLERATAWRTKDAQGNEQVITGVQAAQEWRLHAAQMAARTVTYERAFDAMVSDPQNFQKLYTIVTDERGEYGPAGQQYVVPNKAGFEDMKREAATFARETALNMREQFPKVIAAPPPAEPSVADIAMPTVDAQLKAMNVTLPSEDKQFLAEQLERYVRPTTAQERQAGHGARIVDASFVKLIERTARQAQQVTKAAETATTAATKNTAKLAAAATGRRPAPAAAKSTTVRPIAPAVQRVRDAESAWDNAERAGANALRQRRA